MTIGHDAAAPRRGRKEHVLKEHHVRTLAALFAKAVVEALRELHALALVIHRERWIGEDAVEIEALAFVVKVGWVGQHVRIFQESFFVDAVEESCSSCP